MSAAARSVFALLVCATFAAFFAAQGLKTSPPRVQHLHVSKVFSPNRDGRFDRAHASFRLKRTDEVTATVVDRAGDTVRVIARDRLLRAGRRLEVAWDGRRAGGSLAADGTYRIRLNLRRQGRAVVLPRNIVKDTKPPKVVVTSIGPMPNKGPELLPNPQGKPARVSFRGPDRRREVLVFRTDVRPARRVFDRPIKLAKGASQWTWNGTVHGHRVASGTYVVIVRARDRAGNIGSSAPVPPRRRFAQSFHGRGGITVRYLTAQASAEPTTAGKPTQVAVDSVNKKFSWRLRRVSERRVRSSGSGSRSRLVQFTTQGKRSGLYIFEARTRSHSVSAPVIVQSQRKSKVLVVLPVTTWQGLNPVDDDGDGLPDTLDAGVGVRITRPYFGSGLPAQLPRNEALLLAQLDRERHSYDLTTDVALAEGKGPKLAGHRGVILAGDTRWLDSRAARGLRDFVRDGGKLFSVGTRSLRRSVTLTSPDDDTINAIDPTPETARDLFGAALAPIERPAEPATLVNIVDDVQLFAGTGGQFSGIGAFEATTGVRGGSASVAAAAATQDGQRRVIVAARFGKGLVIRPGLPAFSADLRADSELSSFLERVWTLLARP